MEKDVDFTITTETVVAKTRKLKTKYTLESLQDLRIENGMSFSSIIGTQEDFDRVNIGKRMRFNIEIDWKKRCEKWRMKHITDTWEEL